MLRDPSDHSCENKNKSKNVFLLQIVKDLGVDKLCADKICIALI